MRRREEASLSRSSAQLVSNRCDEVVQLPDPPETWMYSDVKDYLSHSTFRRLIADSLVVEVDQRGEDRLKVWKLKTKTSQAARKYHDRRREETDSDD